MCSLRGGEYHVASLRSDGGNTLAPTGPGYQPSGCDIHPASTPLGRGEGQSQHPVYTPRGGRCAEHTLRVQEQPADEEWAPWKKSPTETKSVDFGGLSSRSYGTAYADAPGRERVTREFYGVQTEVRGHQKREGAALRIGKDASEVAEEARKTEERRRVRELFMVLDTDGSNALDRAEVAELARHLGKKLADNQLDTAMAEMDRDGSGEVDFQEFLAWWEESGQTQSQQAVLNIATARRFIYDVPMFQGE